MIIERFFITEEKQLLSPSATSINILKPSRSVYLRNWIASRFGYVLRERGERKSFKLNSRVRHNVWYQKSFYFCVKSIGISRRIVQVIGCIMQACSQCELRFGLEELTFVLSLTFNLVHCLSSFLKIFIVFWRLLTSKTRKNATKVKWFNSSFWKKYHSDCIKTNNS